MFTKILVPVDGSEDSWAALAQALEIAKEENSTIYGLFVADVRLIEAPYFTTSSMDLGMPAVAPGSMELALEAGRRLSERGHAILKGMHARCQESGVACHPEYAEGVISQTIIDRAKGVDLVAMGRHGENARWAGPMFGSVFEAVVRHAAAPVLAAQAEVHPIKRILVAYDDSDAAKEALQIAVDLVKEREDRSLVLLTVDDGRRQREQQHERAKTSLREMGIHFHALFWDGQVAEQILSTARVESCDLIVMGAYGHTHFMEMLFGSTADEAMRGAICPLILCRR